jgi:DNA-binding NtrC family response regulator
MSSTKPYLKQSEVIANNILKALEYHNGNRTHTARGLGIGIRTLQRTLKKLGLENHLKERAEATTAASTTTQEAPASV